jgi:flagellar biosynthesis/type III secretory pathway protein FliH
VPSIDTAHDYRTCTDQDCQWPLCRAYQDGFADGVQSGYAAGYAQGYADGCNDGS